LAFFNIISVRIYDKTKEKQKIFATFLKTCKNPNRIVAVFFTLIFPPYI